MAAPTTPVAPAPDIFRYADGRQFLQDWWHWKKSVSPRTSFRSFATRAG